MKTDRLLAASAIFLFALGLPMLFASQEILGTSGGGIGLGGELLGPAWLGLAALNWSSRGNRVGGIYGRPVLMANLLLFLPSAMTLLRTALRAGSLSPEARAGASNLWSSDLAGPISWILAGAFWAFALLFLRRFFRPPGMASES